MAEEKYKNIENFDPRTCISGKVQRIHRLTSSIFRKHLLPFDITNSQVSILFIMSKKGEMTQKELGQIAILEKSSTHRNLKRLIEKEYLSKEKFPKISITPKGKRFVNNLIPAWELAMAEIRQILDEEGENAINLIHQKLKE